MAAAPKAAAQPANQRGAARLAAVQALYQMDLGGATLPDVLAEFEAYRLGQEVDGDQYRDADAPSSATSSAASSRPARARPGHRRGAGHRLAAGARRRDAARHPAGRRLRARRTATTCRRASSSANTSTSPTPSSRARCRRWSTPCSTRWRAQAARGGVRSVSRGRAKRPGEFELIERYFRPLADDPRRLRLDRRRGALSPAA